MRYYFRLIVWFLISLALVSCAKDSGIIQPAPGMNVVGYVRDASGNPIPGVVVSDGNDCVITSSDGIYQMKAAAGTRMVYVSVPSGYAIPINSAGLPKIYNNVILRSSEAVQSDFVLTKSSDTKDFSLVVLADIQLNNKDNVGVFSTEVLPGIIKYTQSLSGPLYGFSLGDMGWDNMEILSGDYVSQITRLGFPVFHTIGNHDHDLKVSDDHDASAVYRNTFGPENCSWNIGGVHFVSMDNIIYKGHKEYSRGFTDEQLEWLEKDLSFVDKNNTVVLGIHSPTDKRYAPSSSYCKNSSALYKVLEGRKVIILSGHLHHNYKNDITKDIIEYEHGAACGDLWNVSGLCNDGSPRGFAVYQFKAGKLADRYYMGAETERNYQMKLYAPGAYSPIISKGDAPSGITGVVVNVFAWDKDWKITVDEDGAKTELGPTSNIKLADRDAYIAGSVHKDNDHMFHYVPKTGWSKVSVTAEDPFGTVYTQSLSSK
ncbi:MAG: calcineurin-like phosphoesterase C-terminal domain-containing protein [Candidatus Cryptobacteroides sp.]